jgi:hypothetical protein
MVSNGCSALPWSAWRAGWTIALLYAVPLAFLFSAVFRWRLNGLRDDWWWYLGPMLDARGSKNSKYDSVFHWIAWTSSGQKKDHEGYYVYCDNRAGTLAYIFEAVVFVVGTAWYICIAQ